MVPIDHQFTRQSRTTLKKAPNFSVGKVALLTALQFHKTYFARQYFARSDGCNLARHDVVFQLVKQPSILTEI